MQLRMLYAAKRRSTTVLEQKKANELLIAALRGWAKLQAVAVATKQTSRGRLVLHRSNLKTIEHVLEPNSSKKVDWKKGLQMIDEQFSRSWNCGDRAAHACTQARLLANI